jgi:hypothetical protein
MVSPSIHRANLTGDSVKSVPWIYQSNHCAELPKGWIIFVIWAVSGLFSGAFSGIAARYAGSGARASIGAHWRKSVDIVPMRENNGAGRQFLPLWGIKSKPRRVFAANSVFVTRTWG